MPRRYPTALDLLHDEVTSTNHRLHMPMKRAIKRKDNALLEALLKAGVSPNVFHDIERGNQDDVPPMIAALTSNLDAAKLLRKYNARVWNEGGEPEWELLVRNLKNLVPGARAWACSHPRRGPESFACTMMAQESIGLRAYPNVLTSWPPKNVPLEAFDDTTRRDVEKYWVAVGNLRRLEAKREARRFWDKVHWAVKVRPWIKHWMEDYAVRNSAPGGKFYEEGIAAFEEEWFCA